MKNRYQNALWMVAAGVLTLTSCSSDELVGGAASERGKVSLFGLDVSNIEQVINDASGTSRAAYDVSDYIVEFYAQDSETPYETYVYGDMPGAVELPVGTYTARVRSHELQKAEWDRPYFVGESSPFVITAGEITEIDPVVCKFASLKVSVKFGPKLAAVLGDDVKVTVVANDDGRLVYTKDNTSAGYFATLSGSTTLAYTFSGTVDGYKEEFTHTYTNVEAGQHRIITFEKGASLPVPEDPTGSVNPAGITIDVTYQDVALDGSVDPGKEEVLPDEDEPGKLPDITGGDDPNQGGNQGGNEGGDDPVTPPAGDPITFSGTLQDGGVYTTQQLDEYVLNISCTKGVKDILVKIDSDQLTEEILVDMANLAQEFSLTEPKYYESLKILDLPCGDAVINQPMVKFDITGFMPLIEALDPSHSVFTLTVIDNDDNRKVVSFTINYIR